MKAKARMIIRPAATVGEAKTPLMIFGVAFANEEIPWLDENQEEEWECDVILIPKKKYYDLIATGKGDDPNDMYYLVIGKDGAWKHEAKCDYNNERIKAMMQCL